MISTRRNQLRTLTSIACCVTLSSPFAAAESESVADGKSFSDSIVMASPKADGAGGPLATVLLSHNVTASGIADFEGPYQQAMVRSRAYSTFNAFDHEELGGTDTHLSQVLCSARAKAWGIRAPNPARGYQVVLAVCGDITEVVDETIGGVGTTSFTMPGEATASVAARGLGSVVYAVGPTCVQLTYTAQDVEAGATMSGYCSTNPAASLDAELRARPDHVFVTASLPEPEDDESYEVVLTRRLYLGELRSSPHMVSNVTEFRADIPWEHEAVILKLIIALHRNSELSGPGLGAFLPVNHLVLANRNYVAHSHSTGW